jgi:hypothetical protein
MVPSIGTYHRSDQILNCPIGATNRWGFQPWKVFDFPLENSAMDINRSGHPDGGCGVDLGKIIIITPSLTISRGTLEGEDTTQGGSVNSRQRTADSLLP